LPISDPRIVMSPLAQTLLRNFTKQQLAIAKMLLLELADDYERGCDHISNFNDYVLGFLGAEFSRVRYKFGIKIVYGIERNRLVIDWVAIDPELPHGGGPRRRSGGGKKFTILSEVELSVSEPIIVLEDKFAASKTEPSFPGTWNATASRAALQVVHIECDCSDEVINPINDSDARVIEGSIPMMRLTMPKTAATGSRSYDGNNGTQIMHADLTVPTIHQYYASAECALPGTARTAATSKIALNDVNVMANYLQPTGTIYFVFGSRGVGGSNDVGILDADFSTLIHASPASRGGTANFKAKSDRLLITRSTAGKPCDEVDVSSVVGETGDDWGGGFAALATSSELWMN
jgi:hypothetical protein